MLEAKIGRISFFIRASVKISLISSFSQSNISQNSSSIVFVSEITFSNSLRSLDDAMFLDMFTMLSLRWLGRSVKNPEAIMSLFISSSLTA